MMGWACLFWLGLFLLVVKGNYNANDLHTQEDAVAEALHFVKQQN